MLPFAEDDLYIPTGIVFIYIYLIRIDSRCIFIVFSTDCFLNIHRPCAKTLDETCPGPAMKKERANDRIRTLMDRIRPERGDPRRKPSTLNFAQSEYPLEEGPLEILILLIHF